jgi:hypothetical protein
MTEKEDYIKKLLSLKLRKEHEDSLLIGLENEYQVTSFIIGQMIKFIDDRFETIFISDLKISLATKKLGDYNPAPHSHSVGVQYLMMSYIPEEWKEACEDYLLNKWNDIHESQRELLKKMINFNL